MLLSPKGGAYAAWVSTVWARMRHGRLEEPAGRGCVYAGIPAGHDGDRAALGSGGAGGAPGVRDGGRGDPLRADTSPPGVGVRLGAAGDAAAGRAGRVRRRAGY